MKLSLGRVPRPELSPGAVLRTIWPRRAVIGWSMLAIGRNIVSVFNSTQLCSWCRKLDNFWFVLKIWFVLEIFISLTASDRIFNGYTIVGDRPRSFKLSLLKRSQLKPSSAWSKVGTSLNYCLPAIVLPWSLVSCRWALGRTLASSHRSGAEKLKKLMQTRQPPMAAAAMNRTMERYANVVVELSKAAVSLAQQTAEVVSGTQSCNYFTNATISQRLVTSRLQTNNNQEALLLLHWVIF